jgi:hypothetical protein
MNCYLHISIVELRNLAILHHHVLLKLFISEGQRSQNF